MNKLSFSTPFKSLPTLFRSLIVITALYFDGACRPQYYFPVHTVKQWPLLEGDKNITKRVYEKPLEVQAIMDSWFGGKNPSKGDITLDPHVQYSLKLVEDLCILAYYTYKSKSTTDRIVALTTFAKLRLGTSLLEHPVNFALNAGKKGSTQKYLDIFKQYNMHEEQGGFDATMDFADAFLNNYVAFKESPLMKKLYKFFSYMIAFEVFDKMGITMHHERYSKIERELMKRKYHLGPDFIHCILDTLTFMLKQGKQCIVTGSIEPLFHSGSEYVVWYKESKELLSFSQHLGNPDVCKYDYHTFLAKLDALLDKGKAIIKRVGSSKNNKFEFELISNILRNLESQRLEILTKQSALEMRKQPLGLFVFGDPGTGKSTIQDILFKYYAVLHKQDPVEAMKPIYRYSKNAFAKYWDNFTSNMWCVVFDDVVSARPDKVMGMDESISQLICTINNMSFCPDQAALENKGRTPFKGDLVIVTSNVKDMALDLYMSKTFACYRRMPYRIEPIVKEEFRKKNGTGLDSAKAAAFIKSPGAYDDFWFFKISKACSVEGDPMSGFYAGDLMGPDKPFILNDMKEFLEWYKKISTDHIANQETMMAAAQHNSDVAICSCGGKHPIDWCPNLNEQGAQFYVKDGKTYLIPPADSVDEMVAEYEHKKVAGITMRFKTAEERVKFKNQQICQSENQVVPEYNNDFEAPNHPNMKYVKQLPYHTRVINGIKTCFPTEKKQDPKDYIDKDFIKNQDDLEEFLNIVDHNSTMKEAENTWTNKFINKCFHLGMYCYFEYSLFRMLCKRFFAVPLLRCYIDRWIMPKLIRPVNQAHIMKFLGERVHKKLGKCKFSDTILALLGTTAGVIVAYKAIVGMISWMRPKPKVFDAQSFVLETEIQEDHSQVPDDYHVVSEKLDPIPIAVGPDIYEEEGVREKGQRSKAKPEPTANFWYKETVETTTFDCTQSQLSMKNFSADQVTEYVGRNVAHIEGVGTRNGENFRIEGRALALKGKVWVTNFHTIRDLASVTINFTCSPKVPGLTSNFVQTFVAANFNRIPNTDIVWFRVTATCPKKDITNLIAKDSFGGILEGFLVSRDKEGILSKNKCRNIHRTWVQSPTHSDLAEAIDVWKMIPLINTTVGDCGTPLIAMSPCGPIILGFHFLGNDETAVSQRLTSAMMDMIFNETQSVVCPGKLVTKKGNYGANIKEPHAKSAPKFVEKGCAQYYGALDAYNGGGKSRVHKTVLCDALLKTGEYSIKHGAPDLEDWKPWMIALNDMVDNTTELDSDILEECAEAYTKDVLNALPKGALEELQVLDLGTAVNGAPGVKYIDSVNRNTSAGYPYNKSKKYFLNAMEDDSYWANGVDISPEIEADVEECLKHYMKGERFHPIFKGTLKDEAVTFKKIEDRKVRVFTGGPFAWGIVVRMYYLSFVRLMTKHKLAFECAVGTNTHSEEWAQLGNYLSQHGPDRMIAGDYKAFDKKMPASVMLQAFKVMINIMKEAVDEEGVPCFSTEDFKIMNCIGVDTSYPTIDFKGDLIEFNGTNPSGHPLTVIVNCIANSLYCRYAYIRAAREAGSDRDLSNFKADVALLTYGDDNAMGVSKEVNFFDHTVMQKQLASAGIVYTMADKEAESIPFIHISKVSFLKRVWRWDTDLENWVAPLEHDSINKMLTIGVASKTNDPHATAADLIASALSEYFFYGKETFNKKREMLLEIAIKCDVLIYLRDGKFPTWEALRSRFVKASEGVQLYSGPLMVPRND